MEHKQFFSIIGILVGLLLVFSIFDFAIITGDAAQTQVRTPPESCPDLSSWVFHEDLVNPDFNLWDWLASHPAAQVGGVGAVGGPLVIITVGVGYLIDELINYLTNSNVITPLEVPGIHNFLPSNVVTIDGELELRSSACQSFINAAKKQGYLSQCNDISGDLTKKS